MYKLSRAALKFTFEPIPLLWRTLRRPLSVSLWIRKLDALAVLGLIAWVAVINAYAAMLLQPNFDLYMFGERGAAAERYPALSISAPFAQEIINSVFILLSVAPLIPMAWLYHGSFKAAFSDGKIPLLYLLFGTLGSLISAAIKIPLGLNLRYYSDEFLSQHLVADIYIIFAGTVALIVTAPLFIINLFKLFPSISKVRFTAGLGVFLFFWTTFLLFFSWIGLALIGDQLEQFISSSVLIGP